MPASLPQHSSIGVLLLQYKAYLKWSSQWIQCEQHSNGLR